MKKLAYITVPAMFLMAMGLETANGDINWKAVAILFALFGVNAVLAALYGEPQDHAGYFKNKENLDEN